MKRKKRPILEWALVGTAIVAVAACSDSNDSRRRTPKSFDGTVAGIAGEVLAGASVYLVPATMIDTTEITPAGVLARTTEAFDEPLEDLVAAAGGALTKVTTDAGGKYRFADVPAGSYFVYVEPAAGDSEHLPGGSLCRVAYTDDELSGTTLDVTMSSSPSAAATYVGMTQCLTCHPTFDKYEGSAMRLGFRVPGTSSALQNTSEHTDVDDGLALFKDGTVYTDGTPVYMYDYDSTRGFDKFAASLSDPTSMGGTVYARLWLWRDTAGPTYKITIENVGNPADPNNFAERDVVLTYGGSVYKQRYMIRWPGLNGLYPILQYQTIGSDGIYERTRKQFRDYHLDFYWDDGGTPSDESDDLIKTPANTKNIERNCMGCHAPGYTQFTDAVTGETLCDSIEDPAGEFDIDGDGQRNDLNVSCETCHGPGSEHVAAMGANGRYVVAPQYLSPSRAVVICGRCHDRQEGNGTIKNDHPLNSSDEFPLPGISRDEYLTDYTTRPGPKLSSYWVDQEHSKSHHQQVPDFLRSKHYRNAETLLTCSSCHDVHSGTGFEHGLIADPDEPDSPLCMNCHGKDLGSTTAHTQAELGVAHGSFFAKCIDCHMTATAKTGAGQYGFQLSPPTGTSADEATAYFTNDIHSHSFDVIAKNTVGVKGVLPGKAMPVPYTNSCGTCHDPSNLQY